MHRIGEDVSETLDRVPAVLRVLRKIRAKYACRACESAVVEAPAPTQLIEGGMVSTALIAHIAVAKYGWLLTLYCQTAILAGQGVIVDRQTLARWMKQTAWMLKGLYDLQLPVMHRCPPLVCGERPMPVLAPGHVKLRQFWAHATDDRPWAGPAPPAVAYVFTGGRSKGGSISYSPVGLNRGEWAPMDARDVSCRSWRQLPNSFGKRRHFQPFSTT
jgi:transposase